MVRSSSTDSRAYQALEEVGVKPNVWYKVKVRNEKNDLLEKYQLAEVHHEGNTSHGEKKSHH
jgi:molybdopterin-containing oxidoreductase family iron-sulfur binding subunit